MWTHLSIEGRNETTDHVPLDRVTAGSDAPLTILDVDGALVVELDFLLAPLSVRHCASLQYILLHLKQNNN